MLIRIMLIAALFIFQGAVLQAQSPADKCIQKADHSALTVILVDLSDPISEVENFKKSMAVLQNMIRPSERVIVGSSSDKVGDIKILMDFTNPEQTLWISKLKIQALQKTFRTCLTETIHSIETSSQKYQNSAIIETIGFVSRIFKSDSAKDKRLFVYSDMMQNSPTLSFYKQNTLEINALLSVVKKNDLLAELEGVEVLVAGVGGHENDKKLRELEKFWRGFFEAGKASTKYFGPVLIDF